MSILNYIIWFSAAPVILNPINFDFNITTNPTGTVNHTTHSKIPMPLVDKRSRILWHKVPSTKSLETVTHFTSISVAKK